MRSRPLGALALLAFLFSVPAASCSEEDGGDDVARTPNELIEADSAGWTDATVELRGEAGNTDGDSEAERAGDGEAADGNRIDPETDAHPLFDFAGSVLIREATDGQGVLAGSEIGVLMFDSPRRPYGLLTEVDMSGRCVFYLPPLPETCTPECPATETCGPEGECHPWSQRVSAGTIIFEGLGAAASAIPDDTAWYVVEEDLGDVDLFTPESLVKVTAQGAEIPAFQVELEGMSGLSSSLGQSLELVNGTNNEITWEVTGDGSTVELAILTGWHGAPPVATIWCTAPEETGKIVIAKKLVEGYPPVGGMGLFPHASWIRKVKRKVVATQYGPVEVALYSEHTFSIVH